MPNWKSYDSSVRLLSAILAAHPELKLNYQEIAQCFGDKTTKDSMEFRFRRIKADAKAIRTARANGIDPLTLDIDNGLCKEISKRFGGDCTVSALENRFRRIKGDAKAINDALAKGIDPITIPTDSLNGKIGGGKEIAKYYEDSTASALDHRFRPIKKEALALRAGIAEKFGEETTGKAVSTRFERLKKEAHWDLTNTIAGNNSGSNGNNNNNTPAKPKATPRKKLTAPAGNSNDDDDDEDFETKPTPTPTPTPKKNSLNKTQGGRVSKPQTPRKNGSFNANMAAISVISDEEDNIIKREPTGNGSSRNGHGNRSSFAGADDASYNDGDAFYNGNGYTSENDMV